MMSIMVDPFDEICSQKYEGKQQVLQNKTKLCHNCTYFEPPYFRVHSKKSRIIRNNVKYFIFVNIVEVHHYEM